MESFLPPVLVELGAEDTGAVKALRSLATSLKALPDVARAAADALKVVEDAAVQLGASITEPLDAAKSSIRGMASALRALAKTAQATDDEGKTAMDAIAASAREMGAAVSEGAGAARAGLTGLGRDFRTTAREATGAAAETTAAARESGVAAEESAGAAAASAKASGAAMSETAGALSKYLTGLAGTAFGLFEAVKGASKFNSEITRLNTQANVSKGQLAELGNGALNLAGQVGENPDSLAESLFHVESNFASLGITAPKALDLAKIAAEGAQVGGANLVDVTNALTAAVASGIPGVQNMSQAMGALNAIVGAGDMQMQDLADAFGTGMVATVKGFGLSLTDVGAALAVFGDNNIRGAKAGTDLRMAVQALAQPVSTASAVMHRLGITTGTFAADMRSGGLLKAMDDLMARMRHAGVTAKEQGQIITELFGKKAGTGLNILADQMDRLKSKYPDITAGANRFGSAWQTASHTAGQQFNDLKAGLEALGVKLGTALLPPLTRVLGWVRRGVSWVTEHKAAVQALASVLGGVLVAALWGVVSALVAMDTVPVVAVIAGIAAALIFAYVHFKGFRDVVNAVAGFLKTVFVGSIHLARAAIHDLVTWWNGHKQVFIAAWDAVLKGVHALVRWFDQNVLVWVRARIADLVSWWHDHSQQISEVWSVVWKTISTVVRAAWDGTIKPTLTVIEAYWKLVWGIIRDSFKLVWSVIKDVVTAVMHNVLNTIAVVLDLLTGKWGKAWQDVKKLVSQGLHDVVQLISDIGSGFGNLLYNAGANIINGLVSGIRSAFGAVGSVMSDVTSFISGFLPHSPAKWGPLSGSGSPELAGGKIGSMVADGIASSAHRVGQASRRLAGAASLAVGPGGSYGALAVAPAAGAGAGPVVVNVTVQGSVISKNKLMDEIQTHFLRYGRRNPTTGLTYGG